MNNTYHDKYKCIKCGKDNKVKVTAMDEGYASEVQTECFECGHIDFWAYGYFESASEPPKGEPV